ncbi:HNH endonuclease [Bacillus mobilis]|uniref:HNH endonuclease n=1 Tax=Bacillus mobilis TaxID=2026190 RepID=UPI000A3034D9|nr:HNH endonuclease [Bacillus mobilis]MCU5594596.1 HNH endonuclease [Bacillus mobilis]MCU5739656.1 HNH endonuclease [Bacillus mobilis]MCU9559583.1 HNH endonuclease [Bacillus mobilis]SME29196.1 HNH endonuclease [Bacillus mobilis]HDR7517005.1 HNH endonuclease [Bacillus mobilis]
MKKFVNAQELMEYFNISRETLRAMEKNGLPLVSKGNYELEKVINFFNNIEEKINLNFKIGKFYTNQQIMDTFKCDNNQGMRRSHATNSLVLFTKIEKDLYHDRWNGETLHYTGMGKKGDQTLQSNQNKTLHESNKTDIKVYLFETFGSHKHFFRGRVKLQGIPYQEIQEDQEKQKRKVWIFPLELIYGDVTVPEDVIKSQQVSNQKKAEKLKGDALKERAQKANVKCSIRNTTTKTYVRDEYVAQYAKERAKGVCELCNQPAPFEDKKGEPYLESHHVKWLSNGGEDTIYNTVGVCANCHRRLHVLNDKTDVEKLEEKLKQYEYEDNKLGNKQTM